MGKGLEKIVARKKPKVSARKINPRTPLEVNNAAKITPKGKRDEEKDKGRQGIEDEIDLLSEQFKKNGLHKTDHLLVEKIHGISDQLNLTLTDKKRLENRLISTKNSLEEVRKERERYKARVELLEGTSEALDEIRARVIPAEEEVTDVFSFIKDLEYQLESVFKIKEALEKELNVTRANLEEMAGNNKSLEAKARELTAATAVVEDLREELLFTQEELSNALGMIRELDEKLKSAQDEMKTMYSKLKDSDQSNEKLTNEIGSLQIELEKTMGQRDGLTEKLAGAGRHISELSGENKKMGEDIKVQSERVAVLEKAEKQLTADRDRHLRRIASLEARLEEVIMLKNTLETELISSREMMDEIRNSLSDVRALTKKRFYESDVKRK
ncbi:MAG: hypothetical protein AB1546_09775 [bacterium]